jgi:hypothetical protein
MKTTTTTPSEPIGTKPIDDVPIIRHPKVIRRWHCSANYWDGQRHCEMLGGHIQCTHCIHEEPYITEYKQK